MGAGHFSSVIKWFIRATGMTAERKVSKRK